MSVRSEEDQEHAASGSPAEAVKRSFFGSRIEVNQSFRNDRMEIFPEWATTTD